MVKKLPRGNPCRFYDLTRKLLNERLAAVLSGATPKFSDLRHLFYECRVKFLKENPDLSEPDSEAKNLYIDWEKVVNNWSRKHAVAMGYTEDLYWRVREKLNIWAEGRAVCQGETGLDPLLVERSTRTRITEKCHFMLLCEKITVSRELLKDLQEKGYKINLVSTRGHSPSDVQESIMQVAEELGKKLTHGFYVLVLHDYDLEGIQIYLTLRGRFENVIDVGVNKGLLDYLKSRSGFDERLVVEKVRYKNYRWNLKEEILKAETAYTLEDFDYLQGSRDDKGWVGRRIEIDAIHVEYGMQPFIEYIENQISEHCECWDLSRVGVEPFELPEVDNRYEDAIHDFTYAVSEAYGRKSVQLHKNRRIIKDNIDLILSLDDFSELIRSHLGEQEKTIRFEEEGKTWICPFYNVKEVSGLKEKYEDRLKKDFREDFEGDLSSLNSQITEYYGDVTTAEEDLKSEFEDLKNTVEEAADSDFEDSGFQDKLDAVEWGEEELKEFKPETLGDEVRKVIDGLQKWLEEIEGTKRNTEEL